MCIVHFYHEVEEHAYSFCHFAEDKEKPEE